MSRGPGPTLYGPDGRSIDEYLGLSERDSATPSVRAKSFSGFLAQLAGLTDPPTTRASKPMQNHAWAYAGAMAIAVNVAQATFGIYRETDAAVQRRAEILRKNFNVNWRPGYGKNRRAVQRHLNTTPRHNGHRMKDVEAFPEHPLEAPFIRPNDIITSSPMLWTATALWMVLRGEAFWFLASESGAPIMPGEVPAEIHVFNPDAFTPEIRDGKLVGWYFSPWGSCGQVRPINRTSLMPSEVVHFKFYNPENPVRGLSALSAAAAPIELDMLSMRHDRSALVHGANPGGLLVDKSPVGAGLNATERDRIEALFYEKHAGAENNRRVMVIDRGLEWVPIGMTPEDMQRAAMRQWDRDEVLAVIGTPKASVGVTDAMVYAAQVVQDRNLWRNRIVPMLIGFEGEIDSSILYTEPDSVFAGFDLTRIEALRAGQSEQIDQAIKLTSQTIHMPPKVAFDVVGMDVPDYAGNDVALVSPVLAPASDVIEAGASLTDPFAGATPSSPHSGSESDPAPLGDGSENVGTAKPKSITADSLTKVLKAKRPAAAWTAIIKGVQLPVERKMIPAWISWVLAEQRIQLKALDEVARRDKAYQRVTKVSAEDYERVLNDILASANRLSDETMPLYELGYQLTYEYTSEVDFQGVPSFAIDDERLLARATAREKILLGTAPRTIQKAVRKAIRTSVTEGETFDQLRERVSRVYRISASSSKALMVARTESAGLMNEIRDEMFSAQGISTEDWMTAGDEHVRESHEAYGQAGPKPRGFDYLSIRPGGLPSVGGRLRFPNDPDAPADEVINCRCVKGAVG